MKTYYENDLIKAGEGENTEQESTVLAIVSKTGFLARLQLCGGSSDLAKEGKIPISHYALVRSKESFEDLGKEVNVLVITSRSKAIDFSGDTVLTSYDHNSDLFKQIAEGSNVADSKKMWGAEYLCWVPAVGEFATFYLSSETARREAPAIHARIRKAATLKSQLLSNKKGNKWHGPVITPCSTPFELPTAEALDRERSAFLNAKGSDVEIEGGTTTEGDEERVR